jgi:hypothetical protein
MMHVRSAGQARKWRMSLVVCRGPGYVQGGAE